jgi:hypothetical protein
VAEAAVVEAEEVEVAAAPADREVVVAAEVEEVHRQ